MSDSIGYRVFSVRAGESEGAPPRGVLTTEQPVEMFDWARGDFVPEVLLMSGMKSRGQSIKLLDSHKTDSVRNVLGSFENIRTHDAGERDVPFAFADGDIRVSSTEPDVETKLREGHINEMSVGYRYSPGGTVHVPEGETAVIDGREFVGPVNVRTEWHAQEASLVPLGADDQAQIRGFKSIDDARQKISHQQPQRTETGLTPDPVEADDKADADRAPVEEAKPNTNQPTNQANTMSDINDDGDAAKVFEDSKATGLKAGQEAAEKRAEAIFALGDEVGDPQWAFSQLRSGVSVEEATRAALTKMKEATTQVGHKSEGELGLSKKEKRSYSLRKAMLALAGGRDLDGIEREASDAIANRCGREPEGFFVAPDILWGGARANQTAASATLGDDIVSNDLRAGDFIDVLRPNMLTAQLGIRMLNGLVGDAIIPRKTAGTVATWAGNEVTTAFTEDNIEFDTITLTPQHLGVTTPVSKQLLAQSTPDVDTLLRDDFNQAIAVALDQAVYRGTGTGQPQGIDGATSVPTSAITTTEWAEFVEFQTDVDTGNALNGSLAWVMTPALRGTLTQTLKASGVSGYIWDTSNNTVLGYPAYSTSNCDTSDIIFGNWSDYIMGTWDGVDLIVDPYTAATTRLIKYTIGVMADGDVRRPASFCTNA